MLRVCVDYDLPPRREEFVRRVLYLRLVELWGYKRIARELRIGHIQVRHIVKEAARQIETEPGQTFFNKIDTPGGTECAGQYCRLPANHGTRG